MEEWEKVGLHSYFQKVCSPKSAGKDDAEGDCCFRCEKLRHFNATGPNLGISQIFSYCSIVCNVHIWSSRPWWTPQETLAPSLPRRHFTCTTCSATGFASPQRKQVSLLDILIVWKDSRNIFTLQANTSEMKGIKTRFSDCFVKSSMEVNRIQF